MTVVRRRRLQDGSFGPLEKVFKGETKIEKLEKENAALKQSVVELSAIVATMSTMSTPEK